jgi:hypothetical protein
VAVARLIANHELTAKGLAEGHISLAHAGLLAKAAARFADQYSCDEAELVTAACDQDLDRFTDTIVGWRHVADLEAAAEDTGYRHRTRGLWIQRRLDGSSSGRLEMGAVATANLQQALDSTGGNPILMTR